MSMLPKYRPFHRVSTLLLVASLFASPAWAKSAHDHTAPKTQPVPPPAVPEAPVARKHSPYRPSGMPEQGNRFYQSTWGIDKLLVRRTASGNLIRFSYRVTDVERAKVLGAKESTPHLIDPQRGVMLEVPVMEKIGQLRQTGTPVLGQEYWMVFSNKGDIVKVGDRVDVVIGVFHADGLVVE